MSFGMRVLTLGIVAGIAAPASPQDPTRAQIEQKTSGIIRAMAAPGSLSAPDLPGLTTVLERLLGDVGAKTTRGADLPPLELFVQYAPGSGGEIVSASSAVVAALVANDSVRAVELQRPPSFQQEEVRPFNRDARRTHRVGEFAVRYPGLEGESRLAVVIDAGAVLTSHREFQIPGPPAKSKIRLQTKQRADQHSTHVAGTIAARGIDPRAKGMAPEASILSLDFLNDLQAFAGLAGVLHVTNHSYGPVAGWDKDPQYGWLWWGDRSLSEDEDAKFGKYTARESTLDGLLIAPPRASWLSFVAAGNDRNDGPRLQPVAHYAISIVEGKPQWQLSERERQGDGGDGGLDTVAGLCVAKNVICVGAIHDARVGQPFTTTDFSAFGPTDDGRIKPDLVANGQNLLSTSDATDDAYVEMPGTSMASPAAAGIGIIVGQAFEKFRGRNPLATELKAILIHTAIDAGPRGPDVQFGWGVIDALGAGDVAARTDQHIVETIDVRPGQPMTFNAASDGSPIRVTLVWHDPPAPANTGGLDDRAPALQNDLDVQLTAPGGTRHHPYRLDPANPAAPARRDAPNRVDNVEMVDAPGAAGTWQISVSARPLASGPSQRATLVTSGLRRQP